MEDLEVQIKRNDLDGILGNVDTSNVSEDLTTEYISWDQTWMDICQDISKRSKDPVRKIGAVIINDDHRIVSIGYNGMPNVIEGLDNDEIYPWSKHNNREEDNKYAYVVHAEANAIYNAASLGQSVKGCTLYVTYNCCNECCKAIVQSGIKKVVYMNKKDKPMYNIGRKILKNAGIQVIEYKSNE